MSVSQNFAATLTLSLSRRKLCEDVVEVGKVNYVLLKAANKRAIAQTNKKYTGAHSGQASSLFVDAYKN